MTNAPNDPTPIGPIENRIAFHIGGREVLRLERDGRIFVHDRETTTDLELVDAMRAFLYDAGYLTRPA